MKRISDWLFDSDHPLRAAFFCLVVGAANAYEAAYVDNPDGAWYIVSWLFAAGGAIGFLAFLLIAISEYFSAADQ